MLKNDVFLTFFYQFNPGVHFWGRFGKDTGNNAKIDLPGTSKNSCFSVENQSFFNKNDFYVYTAPIGPKKTWKSTIIVRFLPNFGQSGTFSKKLAELADWVNENRLPSHFTIEWKAGLKSRAKIFRELGDLLLTPNVTLQL